jgi:hypothetical protein
VHTLMQPKCRYSLQKADRGVSTKVHNFLMLLLANCPGRVGTDWTLNV